MLTRRDLLKSAAAGAAVAAVPGAARAQAKRKPTLTIALPVDPGDDRPAPVPLRC